MVVLPLLLLLLRAPPCRSPFSLLFSPSRVRWPSAVPLCAPPSLLGPLGARQQVFYDPKEGTKVSEIAEGSEGAHAGSITGCCWSPDSLKVATCSLDKTVKVWDAGTVCPYALFLFLFCT